MMFDDEVVISRRLIQELQQKNIALGEQLLNCVTIEHACELIAEARLQWSVTPEMIRKADKSTGSLHMQNHQQWAEVIVEAINRELAAEKAPAPRQVPPDGYPCDHPGCLSHVSHPCEGCGRIAGRSAAEKAAPAAPCHIPNCGCTYHKPLAGVAQEAAPRTEKVLLVGDNPSATLVAHLVERNGVREVCAASPLNADELAGFNPYRYDDEGNAHFVPTPLNENEIRADERNRVNKVWEEATTRVLNNPVLSIELNSLRKELLAAGCTGPARNGGEKMSEVSPLEVTTDELIDPRTGIYWSEKTRQWCAIAFDGNSARIIGTCSEVIGPQWIDRWKREVWRRARETEGT